MYFYDDYNINDEENSMRHGTCPVMAKQKPVSDVSGTIKDKDDTASFSGYNGNDGASVVLCDSNKAPPPTFTKNQKTLVVRAWKNLNNHIEDVRD